MTERLSETLAVQLAPVIDRLDELKTRLDIIGAAASGGPADFQKAIALNASLAELLDSLRREVAAAIVAMRVELDAKWQRELFERTSSYAHSVTVFDLEERIARLEMMSVPRRISPDFEAKLRAEYPGIDWEAAMRVFDRWLVYEKPPANPSPVIRRFLKQWQQGVFRDGFRPGMGKPPAVEAEPDE